MGFSSWIEIGLITGLAVKWIMPGREPGGLIVEILLGVSGAVAGGLFGCAIGFGSTNEFDVRIPAIAFGGAVVLIVGHRLTLAGLRA